VSRSHSRPSSAEPRRSPLTPFYAILGLVALAGLGILAYQMFGRSEGATAPVQVAVDPQAASRAQGIALGPEDAPVVIYEFADFQCYGCAQFASLTMPVVKERFVDTGMVRYVFYDYPLVSIHPNAFLAARAGRCANEQGRFWPYHDRLFQQQGRWSTERNPSGMFVDYARQLGLDAGAFEGCLRSDRFAAEVTQSMALAESLGVQGTPTLFVNGKRLQDVPSASELDRIIREEMGGAGTAAPAAPASE
jgi:protein-disulfide isomerase